MILNFKLLFSKPRNLSVREVEFSTEFRDSIKSKSDFTHHLNAAQMLSASLTASFLFCLADVFGDILIVECFIEEAWFG